MTAYEQQVLALRRQARAQQTVVDARRLEAHRAVADALDGDRAAAIGADAQAQIARWLTRQLCHPDYAVQWSAILALAPATRRQEMLREDPVGIALRQNTPLADFLVRGPA